MVGLVAHLKVTAQACSVYSCVPAFWEHACWCAVNTHCDTGTVLKCLCNVGQSISSEMHPQQNWIGLLLLCINLNVSLFSTVACGHMLRGSCVALLWPPSRRTKLASRCSPSRGSSLTGPWPNWTAPWGGLVALPRPCCCASSMMSAGQVSRKNKNHGFNNGCPLNCTVYYTFILNWTSNDKVV